MTFEIDNSLCSNSDIGYGHDADFGAESVYGYGSGSGSGYIEGNGNGCGFDMEFDVET